ncbi:NAD(P)-binding protein [Calocera cornea HHB12733]|uniref:NAD(P)-binding protein n=1 Tax=Calocera cornea HHB12733 TaxID=1353952 RepID=A0A165CX29_9BASI|nr:NAD(P)-binding protein [Calocera cornea HHB12733]
MPAVQSPAKVLVTGANGFLALHIVTQLLAQDYSVRGTVRTASKGEWLKNHFSKFADRFEYIVVSDITKEGAFDEAIQGADAVLHTAAPFPDGFAGTYESIYVPSVHGAQSIFKSLLGSTTVKRVVFTSSFVAMMEPHDPGYTWSETDWNDNASKLVKGSPHELSGYMLYLAAKTDAERVAWDFYHNHQKEVQWDLVTLMMPYIFGPALQEESNFSTNVIYRKAFEERPKDQVGKHAGLWSDVRDVSRAHVLSLQKQQAGGERIFIAGGAFVWQDVYKALQTLNNPEIPRPVEDSDVYDIADTAKAARILGLDYHTFGESVRDTLEAMQERRVQ